MNSISTHSYYSYLNNISLIILLPDFVIELEVSGKSSLKEIKESLISEIRAELNYTNEQIKEYASYIFTGVNKEAEIEEYYDESQMICNLNLIDFVLKYIPGKVDLKESVLSSKIIHCSNVNFDDLPGVLESFFTEIRVARKHYLGVAKEVYDDMNQSVERRMLFMYSATYMPDRSLTIRQRLQALDCLYICSFIVGSSKQTSDKVKRTTKVPKDATVYYTIWHLLVNCKEYFEYGTTGQGDNVEDWAKSRVGDFVLKVSSLNEFMITYDNILINYDYIQNCLYNDEIPVLSLYPVSALETTEIPMLLPTYFYQNPLGVESRGPESFVSDTPFSFYVKSAQSLNKENAKVYVRSAIFCGLDTMRCGETKSNCVPDDRPEWNQNLSFDMKLTELPRNSRLCITLVQKQFRKNGTESVLGSVCLNIFDFLGRLIEGSMELSLTPIGDNANYDPKMPSHCIDTDNCIRLSVQFVAFRRNMYRRPSATGGSCSSTNSLQRSLNKSNIIIQRIRDIVEHDLLYEILEQDRDFLRTNMVSCPFVAASLPRLAASIRWSNPKEVATFYDLLSSWGDISLEHSLQLLSGTYLDSNLRSFAVRNLEKDFADSLSDLGLYLLQLVQALKYESYLYNDLGVFLLKVALSDRNVGSKFFWYLRSEVHDRNVKVYFGVLLEAFCRGCTSFMPMLEPQLVAVDKFVELSNYLKEIKDTLQEETMRHCLTNQYKNDCQAIRSLINPAEQLGTINVANCKVKISKKRPMFLEWNNLDPYCEGDASLLQYIFKNGDDLRQDMLTLQLLSIFDWIWKRQFQDMKLLPYGCLATGPDMGLIQVVKESKTVMDIQKAKVLSAMQMNPFAIYNWLKLHNNDPEKLQRAVDNFTKSCAGYSVATFILGIRDRHPDNIMVNKKGQIFHIDFGHILNNTKKKFGINRERVPFVLTDDFICVIVDGCKDPLSNQKFAKFTTLCTKAYTELRKQSTLILTLFSLMTNCGLPELSSVQDLEYLRKTLQVESKEEDAVKYFNGRFNSAYKDAWSTKFDWIAHLANTH